MLNPSQSAIEVFLERSIEVDEALTRLHDTIHYYATLPTEDIDWGHVKDLEFLTETLNEISQINQKN